MESAAKKPVRKYKLNSSRVHLEKFVRRAAVSVPQGSRLLDAGAGNCPYAHLFGTMTYETTDFGKVEKTYGHLTYECDLASIPVESERYDLALLTQVLEHLPDPLAVLKELHRVLRPGHRLWLSQPFYYEEHEQPYDFYRYTQFGLRHLLQTARFRVEEMFWLEGYVGTLAYHTRTRQSLTAEKTRTLRRRGRRDRGGCPGRPAPPVAVRPVSGVREARRPT